MGHSTALFPLPVRRPRSRSLRRRLMLGLLAPVLLASALMLLDAYRHARQVADLAYDRLIAASALAIANRLSIVDGAVDVDLPYVALEMLASHVQDRVFYRIAGPGDGFVTGCQDLPPPPVAGGAVFYDAVYRGEAVRIVALARRVAGPGLAGDALVQVAQTRSERNLLARDLARDTGWRLLLLVLLVGVLAWLGIRLALAPLARLQREIRSRSPQDLRPLHCEVPREVRALVAAIDSLMLRLAGTLDAMQEFISDASHQLRTPLAALQTQAEVALREADAAALRAAVGRILEVTARTTRLANQLLSHARGTSASAGARFEPLDLADLAAAVSRDHVPAALARRIDLGFEAQTGSATVLGDPLLLREMLANLLDNAIRYSPDGARITVRVGGGGGRAWLEVEDSGPGIPAAQRQRVFERFYRIPGSAAEGSGLGLPIVRMVVQGHGGQVTLHDGGGGSGLRVRVELPAAGAA